MKDFFSVMAARKCKKEGIFHIISDTRKSLQVGLAILMKALLFMLLKTCPTNRFEVGVLALAFSTKIIVVI